MTIENVEYMQNKCRGADYRADLFHWKNANEKSFEEFIEEKGKRLELRKKIKKLRGEITDVNWKKDEEK